MFIYTVKYLAMVRMGLVFVLLVSILVSAVLAQEQEDAASTAPSYSTCQRQFLDALIPVGRNASAPMVDLIDPDTPEQDCIKRLCLGDYATCDPIANNANDIPYSDMILVFSDEFNTDGREFGVKARDPRWTAEDIYYFPTQDIEVYKPEQVTTSGALLSASQVLCSNHHNHFKIPMQVAMQPSPWKSCESQSTPSVCNLMGRNGMWQRISRVGW